MPATALVTIRTIGAEQTHDTSWTSFVIEFGTGFIVICMLKEGLVSFTFARAHSSLTPQIFGLLQVPS
jgi:hypothetical protein